MKAIIVLLLVAASAFWLGTYFGTTNIDPVLLRDNVLLKEQVDLQK